MLPTLQSWYQETVDPKLDQELIKDKRYKYIVVEWSADLFNRKFEDAWGWTNKRDATQDGKFLKNLHHSWGYTNHKFFIYNTQNDQIVEL